VRNLFLALLAANLLFLAWARWVDTPPEPTRQDAVARLPRLMLVTEAPPAPKRTSASAQKMIFRDPEGTCTSIGPFNDLASAVKAAAALTERGFSPRQRVEEGETVEGYWVYVGGMGSDDDVARVVQRLEKSGFTDAHVMKEAAEGRRVSVGLFSKRERAEHRALAVQHMGLDPQIAERRFPGTVYWVDVTLEPSRTLPTQSDATAGKVNAQACPPAANETPDLTPTQTAEQGAGGIPATVPRTKVASAPGVP